MPNIDFLPAFYRQQTVHRKANVWRLLVGGGFGAALLCSFLYQQLLYRQAAKQLDELKPQYEQAEALASRLASLQSELKAANQQADLFTYLRHPWPRTQLLAAALGQLPECVTLREIHIARQQPAGAEPSLGRPMLRREEEAELKKLSPAERDLLRLCEETAAREPALTISGITTDTAVLQHYLVLLGREKLFVKVELTSLEANHEERPGTWRFAARLEIRPGLGQPGAPEPSLSRMSAAATPSGRDG